MKKLKTSALETKSNPVTKSKSSRKNTGEVPFILDEETQRKTQLRRLDELERINYTIQPELEQTGTLTKAKKLLGEEIPRSEKHKLTRDVQRVLFLKRNLQTFIEEATFPPPSIPSYLTAEMKPSKFPPRRFCSICGYFSAYTCKKCGSKYCSISCRNVHDETRCLKFVM